MKNKKIIIYFLANITAKFDLYLNLKLKIWKLETYKISGYCNMCDYRFNGSSQVNVLCYPSRINYLAIVCLPRTEIVPEQIK